MIQLVCHFPAVGDGFLDDARHALEPLRSSTGVGVFRLARSTEHGDSWVLTAEFGSVPDYRRAISTFEARTVLVPFLSRADPATSGVFEIRYAATGDEVMEFPGIVDH
jgi:hypothetical protein